MRHFYEDENNPKLEELLRDTLYEVADYYGVGITGVRSFINGEGIDVWEPILGADKYERHRVSCNIKRKGKRDPLKPNHRGQVGVTFNDGVRRHLTAHPNKWVKPTVYFNKLYHTKEGSLSQGGWQQTHTENQ